MKQKRGVVIITAVVVVGVVGVAVGWLLKMKEEGCEERRRRENEERKVHLIMELRNVDDQVIDRRWNWVMELFKYSNHGHKNSDRFVVVDSFRREMIAMTT
eukprot:m.8747 g.8747  ORF g.8747 m.8747 type:complete len:101 (-) comp3241_c0_seq1:322-624(-)